MSAGEQDTITVEDLLAEIAPRTVTARVLLRQDLVDAHRALDEQLQREMDLDLTENRPPVGPRLAVELLAFQEEMEEAKRAFEFRRIGRKPWQDLLAKHPPTAEQKKANSAAQFNPLTFPVAAVAASCVSPKMTVEDVARFEVMLDESQWSQLWSACLEANIGGGDSPKSFTAGQIARANAALGITAAPEASLDPGSLADQ